MKQLLVVVVLLCAGADAKTQRAPLPQALVAAKTVYIDNRTGYADVVDRAYSEVLKAHRFAVVESPEAADVLLIFTAKEFIGGFVTRGTVDGNGAIDTSSKASRAGQTVLTVASPSTGLILWSDTRSWGGSAKWAFVPGAAFVPHSATRDLLRSLHRRLAER